MTQSKVAKGSDDMEKLAYINLEFFDSPGFIKADLFREDNLPHIMIKFDCHKKLVSATNAYNQRNQDARFAIKRYYRIGNERYSCRDFKIIDVPSSITNEQIIEAISKHLKR